MQIKNQKLSNDVFFAERKEVLQQWQTGQDVDFDEAVAYQKSIPQQKRFGAKLAKAVEENVTLIQPRAGVALPDEHLKLLQFLEPKVKRICCRQP